jgi:hypothetical protein
VGRNLRVMIDICGPLVSSALLLIGGVHIGVRAMLDMYLIWFGFIARLSKWEAEGLFFLFNRFLPAFTALTWGDGGQHPVVRMELDTWKCRTVHTLTVLYLGSSVR